MLRAKVEALRKFRAVRHPHAFMLMAAFIATDFLLVRAIRGYF